MSASQEQKVDFLLKKIGYTASKTGIAEDETGISGTKKAPFAEPIPSPLTLPGANVWSQSNQIPATPPGATTSIVRVYKTGTAQQLTFDSTVADNRSFVARETAGEVTSTVVGDWVDTQFGADYIVKVYKGDPNAGGVQLSAAGSGSNDTWFFDYSAGVLNFNGTNVPAGITTTNIYIEGYRYTGIKGVTGVAQTFTDLEISGITTFNGAVDMNSTLDVDGDTQLDDLNVAGVATFSNTVDVNADLNVSGLSTFTQVSVNAGVVTFTNVSSVPSSTLPVGTGGHIYSFQNGLQITGGMTAGSGTGDIRFATNGFQRWQITSNGDLKPLANNTNDIGDPTNYRVAEFYGQTLDISGISSFTDAIVAGVSTFTGAIDANGTLDVDGDTQLDDLNVSGVATFSKLIDANNRVDVVGGANIDQVNVTGVSTFAGAVDLNAGLDIDGQLDVDELVVAGVSTFNSRIDLNAGLDVDGQSDLDEVVVAGVATFSNNIDANAGLDVDGQADLDEVVVAGVSTFNNAVDINSTLDVDGDTQLDDLNVSGVATFSSNIDANGNLDVDGQTDLDVLNVSDTATFTGIVTLRNANPEIYFSDTTAGSDYRIRNNGGTFRIQEFVSGDYDTRFKIINNGDHNGTVEATGDLFVGAGLSVTGVSTFRSAIDLNAGLDVDGHTELDDVNVSGAITATTFTGNLAGTVNTAAQPNITSLGTLSSATVSGNINANGNIVGDSATNITGIAGVTASTLAGTLQTAAQPNVTSLGTLSSLNVTGDVSIGGTLTYEDVTNIDSVGLLTARSGIVVVGNGVSVGSGIVTSNDGFSGNLTGNVIGNLTGNADTAGKADGLTTARTIGGVSFDGSSNINLPGVNQAGNQDTSGNADTATALETARDIGGVSFDGTASINLPGVNQPGNQNTSGTAAGLSGSPNITITDVSGVGGNFTGVVTASSGFSGNLTGTLQTAAQPNITSLGTLSSATVSGNINANGNIIGDNSTNISGISSVTATNVFGNLTGNVVGNLTGNADTAGKADGLTTARTIGGVSFDGSANINLPGVNTSGNQDTSGNAATATALETARDIGGVSFDGTASINLPGVNQTGNQNTSGTAAGLSGSPNITITDVSGVGGNFTGVVTASSGFSGNLTGTLQTAAQPNITSLGTLSSATVSGNINANGNIVGDNSTNISGISSVTATSYFGNGENLTGIGTQGSRVEAESLTVSGISTLGITSTTDLEAQQLNVTGVSTFNGNIKLTSNRKITFHSNSTIEATPGVLDINAFGPNNINIQSNAGGGSDGDIQLRTTQGGRIDLTGTGGVGIYHTDTAKKLETTSTGVVVTGIATASKAVFTEGGVTDYHILIDPTSGTRDGKIKYDGSKTLFIEGGTSSDNRIEIHGHQSSLNILCEGQGETELYYSGRLALQTQNGGVGIVGILTAKGVNAIGVVTATSFSGNLATTDLTGTITNAQLAGSIANDKLSNSTVSYGGVSLALGSSDATPAFDLSDATNYPTSSLSGTITNAQLAGSIANDKLANSTVSYGGISLALGGTDATPAFDLSDATNYPFTSLTGITTSIVGDTTPTLGGNLDGNSKSIFGVGILTATSFSGTLITAAQPNVTSLGTLSSLTVSGNINANGNIVGDSSTNITGIAGVTASTLTGTLQTAAQPNITSVGTLSSLNVTGNVSVGGTLTYEDVTNIDSVGLVTARNGVRITAGGLDVTGVSTFSGNITGTGDLTLTSTDTGSSAAPIINLFRNSASPADADYLGQIKFQGESDTGVQRNYAKITGKILDASNGTEDGIIEFAHIKAGSQTITGRFRSDSLQLLNGTALSVAGDITANGNIAGDGSTNITGINEITAAGNITANGNIIGDDSTNISGINSVTATSFFGNGENLTGIGTQTNLGAFDNLVVAGIATFYGTTNLDGTVSSNNSVITFDNIGGSGGFIQINNDSQRLRLKGTGSAGAVESAALQLNTQFEGGSTQHALTASHNTSTKIYHLGSQKFETSSTGAVVTGILTATSFSGDGSALTGIGTQTNLGAFDNIVVAGVSTFHNNVFVGSAITMLSSSGIVSATKFCGDGSALTGISAGFNADADVNLFASNTCSGCNLDGSGCYNIFFGSCAGKATTSGDNNILIGTDAGCSKTGAGGNISIGCQAGASGGSSTGGNIAIGRKAGYSFNNGNNIAIGQYATAADNFGSGSVALGHHAGKCNQSGSNTFIGCGAGKCDRSQFATFVGNEAGICACTGVCNVFLGAYTGQGKGGGTTGKHNTFVGTKAGRCFSSGCYNAFLGHEAGCLISSGIGNVFLGDKAGNTNTTGSYNIAIGRDVELPSATGDYQLAIGAGTSTWISGTSDFMVGIGTTNPSSKLSVAGDACVSGVMTATTFDGELVATNLTGALPAISGVNLTNLTAGNLTGALPAIDGSNLTGISAGFSPDADLNLISQGTCSGCNFDGTNACDNILIGSCAGKDITSGADNVFIGKDAGCKTTTHGKNVYIGLAAGCCGTASGSNFNFANTSVGAYAGAKLTTQCFNTNIGYQAGQGTCPGDANTFIGGCAGLGGGCCGCNVYIGFQAGSSAKCNARSIFVGHVAGQKNQGNHNIAMGACSLKGSDTHADNTGYGNVFFGHKTGCRVTTGHQNIFIGMCAGQCTTSGDDNIAMGKDAGFKFDGASNNVILGCEAGCNMDGTTIGNVFIGRLAGKGTSGCSGLRYNVFIGGYTGEDFYCGCCNIAIGADVQLASATGSCQLAIGQATNRWILGDSSFNVCLAGAGVTMTSGTTSCVIAHKFCGDGSCLTNVASGINSAGTSTFKDLVITGGINVSGVVTATTLFGDGSNLTGITATGVGAIGGLTVKNQSGSVVGTAGSVSTLDFNGSTGVTVTATSGASGIATIAISGGFSQDSQGNLIAGGGAGAASDSDTCFNILLGCNAGKSLNEGDHNIFLGCYAGESATSAACNIFLGTKAGCSLTSGSQNIFLGTYSNKCRTSGNHNISFGHFSAQRAESGSYNVSIGLGSRITATTGNDAVAIGRYTLRYVTGNCNIGMGMCAGAGDSGGASGTFNVAIGRYAGKNFSSGIQNVFIGKNAGRTLTTGSCNIALGSYAMGTGTVTGDKNVAIGDCANQNASSGGGNVMIGHQAGKCNTNKDGNVFVGCNAGRCNTGGGNVYIGNQAGCDVDTSSACFNIAIGCRAGYLKMTGSRNIVLGCKANVPVLSASDQIAFVGGYDGTGFINYFIGCCSGGFTNVGIGTTMPDDAVGAAVTSKLSVGIVSAYQLYGDGSNLTGLAGFSQDSQGNLYAGTGAGENSDSDTCFNIALGCCAGYSLNEGDDNVILGCHTGKSLTSGTDNILLGKRAGCSLTSADDNIFIGGANGRQIETSGDNILIGRAIAQNTGTPCANIIMGLEAAYNLGNACHNVILGTQAGCDVDSGTCNVFMGYQAGGNSTTGTDNVALGSNAMGSGTVTGKHNVVMGCNAGLNVAGAFYNVLFGFNAGKSITGGGQNVFIGACAGCSVSGGAGNVFIGGSAGKSSTGTCNVIIGLEAGKSLGGHNHNIFIGTYAACAQSAGNCNIAIGCKVSLPISTGTAASNQLVIGSADGNWINGNCDFNVGIGTTNPSAKLSVAGDACVSGVTTFAGPGTSNSDGSTTISKGLVVIRPHGANSATLTVCSTESSGAAGPTINLVRDDGSPTDDDFLGILKFNGSDSAGNQLNYVQLAGITADVTDGTEDGTLQIKNVKAGSETVTAEFRSDSLQLLNGTSLTAAGDVSAPNFNSTSDIRYKTNIKPIDDPISKVIQIEGVSFNWKKDDKPALGVIADQVEKILPQLVHGDDPKTVNYNGLVGLLIEVVKDQQKQIDTLSERISKLE